MNVAVSSVGVKGELLIVSELAVCLFVGKALAVSKHKFNAEILVEIGAAVVVLIGLVAHALLVFVNPK